MKKWTKYSPKKTFNGKSICTVTHPGSPNWSGHSRGRKIHLAKDEKLSVCNMLIDNYIHEHDISCCEDNGRCKICFKEK